MHNPINRPPIVPLKDPIIRLNKAPLKSTRGKRGKRGRGEGGRGEGFKFGFKVWGKGERRRVKGEREKESGDSPKGSLRAPY